MLSITGTVRRRKVSGIGILRVLALRERTVARFAPLYVVLVHSYSSPNKI